MDKIDKYLNEGPGKYTNETAAERFEYNEKEVQKYLKALSMKFKKYKKDFVKKGGTDWGYVGSMAYAKEQLENIIEHFS